MARLSLAPDALGIAAARYVTDLGVLHADDQHVLGEPSLLARLPRGDAQRVAFLAEQCVAPVARTHAPDLLLVGEVQDQPPVGREIGERVQPTHEVVVATHVVEGHRSDAGHDVHARRGVRTVGDHDPGAAEGAAHGPHEIGDDVHRPILHGPVQDGPRGRLGLGGRHPVVGGPDVLALGGADEGQLLRPGDVQRMAPVEVAVGIGARIQREECPVAQHPLDEPVVLALRSIAPDHARGPGHLGGLLHPLLGDARDSHIRILVVLLVVAALSGSGSR